MFGKKKKQKPVRILDSHVYHISRSKKYNGMEGHDVVVLKHFKRTKWSKVKSITSLEREKGPNKIEFIDFALKRARRGKITPVPINEIRTRHWSGIDDRAQFVKDSDLERRRYTKKAKIKKKYLT